MKTNNIDDEINNTDKALLKHQKKFDRIQKKESKRLKRLLFFSKIFNKEIKPDNDITIQKHPDAGGRFSYYVASPYLKDSTDFCSVLEFITKDGRHVYKGIVGGADNAIGVIESNVPLEEIVASPYGNEVFFKMLSEPNAEMTRDEYYKKNGLSTERIEGHMTYFANPIFVLGTITKDEKGKYSFNQFISEDIEEKLYKEREKIKKIEELQNSNDIYIKSGPMVIPYEGCEIYNGSNGLGIKGVNSEGIAYSYDIFRTVKTEDGILSIGNLEVGYDATEKCENEISKYNPENMYYNVAIWSQSDNLIKYCIKQDQCEFVKAIGRLITVDRLEDLRKEEIMELGGIILNQEGTCLIINKFPPDVEDALQQYIENRDKGNAKILQFPKRDEWRKRRININE